MIYERILRPLLFRGDPERTHEATLALASACGRNPIARGLVGAAFGVRDRRLARERLGIRFPNPIGLAAGFDKDARLVAFAPALGFGFVEVGSVSARPWPGNPRPRVFRLPADEALVNRVGLPSEGAERVAARLASVRRRVPVGVNLVKTADPAILGDAAIEDFRESYRRLAPVADFVVLNVSCPNTADGRSFEDPGALSELLAAIGSEAANRTRRPPLAVKLSNDHTRESLVALVERGLEHGADGFVLTNSSRERPADLRTDPARLAAIGRGGLTGRPLLARSIERVRWAREVGGEGPLLIGAGGVRSGEDARRMLEAGADLIEVYTGLVYRGPGLAREIGRSLRGSGELSGAGRGGSLT